MSNYSADTIAYFPSTNKTMDYEMSFSDMPSYNSYSFYNATIALASQAWASKYTKQDRHSI